MVRRGIDREAATDIVAAAPLDERARIEAAYAKIRRLQPQLAYSAVARKLERLGFPAQAIYRLLRERAGAEVGALLDGPEGA